MRRSIKAVILAGALIVFAVVALKGAAILIPTGTWVPQTNLSGARANASAALLQDGRVLVTGGDSGSGPVTTADFFAADGTISAAPPMVNARSRHVAVTLQDGRVLVAGGVTAGGSATSTAEIYDPATNSWANVGTGMTEARSNASVALLSDGRVIIAGGQNGSSISSTIEIFDPVAGGFSFVGTMSSSRTRHAMAVLHDGRIIIVGGSNGTSPVASTDIFDPVAGTTSAGPSLAVARFGHSATTLLNGQAVVIGGNDGNADPAQMDLASAELFDPAAGTFTTLAANMATPREGHLAILLPNNNNVLIVGGMSSGATIADAELFMPQESPEGVWTYGFGSTGSMSTARSNAAGSANQVNAPTSVMQRNGVVMVAGGNDPNGNALNSTEAYGYATIQTDQSDYAPGTIVTITGSGWKPGETVNLQLVESPLFDTHGPFSAVADASGNIVNTQFSPDEHDVSITFTLTAAGQTSGFLAQTIFTDANPQSLDITTGQNPNPVVAGASATYTLTESFNGNSTQCKVDLTAAPTGSPAWPSPPVGGFFSFSPATLINTGPTATSLTIKTPAGMAANTYNFTATATPENGSCQNNPKTLTVNGTIVVSAPANVATTLVLNSVSPNAVPFGSTGPVTFAGTLTRNDTSAGVVGATVNFSVDGGAAIPATTGAGGGATFTTYNSSALSVGPHNVAASFTAATISGTSYVGSSSGILSLTVNKADTTITWANPADITYGTALDATQLNATASVPGSFVYTPVAGTVLNAGNGQTLKVDFTPTDTTDYNTATKTVQINVLKATPTVTWANPADITYGTALSATQLDATFTAVVNGSTVTVVGTPIYTPAAGTVLNAGSAQSLSVSFTPTDTTDYNSALGSAKINVLKATPTVTWANPADITYGTALNATQLDATFTWVVNGSTVTVGGAPTYTPPSGTLLNAGSAQSLSVSFTPTDTTNYNNATGSAQINVLKATPTVTWANPADITYGTALNATQLDATFTWVVNGSTVTVGGAPTYTPPSGTLLNAGSAQSLSVSFTPTDTTNYNNATGSAQINVLKATPTVTWANPADITYGTALSATQLNATFSWVVNGSTVTVGGTPTYTPPSGTLLNAGNAQSLSVNFAPSDTTNYNSASGSAKINVLKATPTVTWANPADITYGTALSATQLDATFTWVVNGSTVTIGGAPTYTPPSGTLLNAGSAQSLSVSFTPTDTTNYNNATGSAQINVLKATPTVTWANPADITYGTALSATQLDATFTAVVNGSTVTVGGTPTYAPTAETVLSAGSAQNLSVSFTPTDTTDYNATMKTVQINVLKATPTVTWANPADITYGTALSATQLDATFTAVVNGSTVTVAGTPTYTPAAGTVLNAGSAQNLSVSFTPTDTTDYNATMKTVQINVLKATPTVTWANPADITYGTALSATQLDATFTAVVNGSTVTVAGTPTYTPAAGTVLNAGSAQNLSVSFTPTDTTDYNTATRTVQINVLKATPAVTWANPADITYGTALSATQLDATFTAVVNGSTVTVAGTPTYTPAAGTVLNAGSAQNLSVSFTPTDTTDYNTATRTVQINVLKATPAVTWANPADITYGTALSATQLDATFTWVVNGSTVTVGGTPTYNPPSGTVLNAGSAQSLSVSFTPTDTMDYNSATGSAKINVLKATPAVTWANPADITYGTALSATQLDATFTWVVNGSTVIVGGTPTYTPPSGTVLNVGQHQALTVSFTPSDTTDYNPPALTTVYINVNYGFLGLQSPYMPPPTTFNVKRTMPLKWQYTNSGGAVVNSASANPTVLIQGPYACGGGDSAGDITVNDAGASGYQYDPTTNTWQFNWQIKGNAPGCYDIFIKSQQSGQTNGAFPISVVNQ